MEHEPEMPPAKRRKGQIFSFYADGPLARKLKMDKAKVDRDYSYIVRRILRKHYGLKDTGTL